jgi:hypothetical protein
LEKAIPEMIRVLKEEGYITRQQELAAYVAFDLPYDAEGSVVEKYTIVLICYGIKVYARPKRVR